MSQFMEAVLFAAGAGWWFCLSTGWIVNSPADATLAFCLVALGCAVAAIDAAVKGMLS